MAPAMLAGTSTKWVGSAFRHEWADQTGIEDRVGGGSAGIGQARGFELMGQGLAGSVLSAWEATDA